MKKLYYYIPLLIGVLLYACKNDVPTIEGFESDVSSIEAEAVGGEYFVTVRSAEEWFAIVDEPWVIVSPANGRGETRCSIKIDSALMDNERSTTINIRSAFDDQPKSIAITQKGFEKAITPEKSSIDIAASAIRADRWVEFDVTTNVKFKIKSGVNWIEVDTAYRKNLNLNRGMRPRTTRVRLDWKMNSDPKERIDTLCFISDDADTLATLNIRQAAGPNIKDNRAGDSLAVITIFEKLECLSDNGISSTESMNRWDCVRLWKSTDKTLPAPEAVGRVRDLDLSYFNTEDGVPVEIKYLKYLETLSLFGNVNTMLKSIKLCEEVATLEYLKDLRSAAFGLVSLPDNFTNLKNLESLDLNSNNFNEIPEVITRENFPKLKKLDIASNRRASITDLRKRETANEKGIGIYANMNSSDVVRNLFLWEELEELALSYNYIEGKLPDFNDMPKYTAEDVKIYDDTVDWAVGRVPRILPNMRSLKINLNFMSGDAPDWLLYHPRLLEWGPEVLIFPQQEKAVNSEGESVGFDNAPANFEYYFKKYPLYRGRYEGDISDDKSEGTEGNDDNAEKEE
ncbi:MAG: hypothetical protein J6U73_08075 [Alistipes sp.]|nr:hypothetical protein [Alistipes sp.]